MRKSSSCASRRLSSARGTVLSELMIVTPFVVMVTFGTIDLSFALKQHSAMVEAARVAARAAAILPPNTDESTVVGSVYGSVIMSLSYESSGVTPADVTVQVESAPIATSMLAPVVSLSSSLDMNLSSSGGGGNGKGNLGVSAPALNVRYIRVRLSSTRNSFSRYFSGFLTPRDVVSVFPLAAGNTVTSTGG